MQNSNLRTISTGVHKANAKSSAVGAKSRAIGKQLSGSLATSYKRHDLRRNINGVDTVLACSDSLPVDFNNDIARFRPHAPQRTAIRAGNYWKPGRQAEELRSLSKLALSFIRVSSWIERTKQIVDFLCHVFSEICPREPSITIVPQKTVRR